MLCQPITTQPLQCWVSSVLGKFQQCTYRPYVKEVDPPPQEVAGSKKSVSVTHQRKCMTCQNPDLLKPTADDSSAATAIYTASKLHAVALHLARMNLPPGPSAPSSAKGAISGHTGVSEEPVDKFDQTGWSTQG
jgi:hypothetical protein